MYVTDRRKYAQRVTTQTRLRVDLWRDFIIIIIIILFFELANMC